MSQERSMKNSTTSEEQTQKNTNTTDTRPYWEKLGITEEEWRNNPHPLFD